MASGTFAVSGEPYVGLRPYNTADRHLFCGRDRESNEVSALWRSNRLLVLYGPSGVGKTSLLQAGVIPRFDQETADVLPLGRLSYSSALPAGALHVHNPYTFALLSSWCPGMPPTELTGLSVREFLNELPPRTDRYSDPLPVLGAIDQFEELFIDVPHRQRHFEEFLDQLASAVNNVPILRLLISIREDALVYLIPQETRLAGHSRARFPVHPFSRTAALEVVTGPLTQAGRSFALNVATELVDQLLTTEIPDGLGKTTTVTVDTVDPMRLQVVCTTLWRALPDDIATITEEHLQQYADVRSVHELCTRIIADVASEHGTQEWRLYDWLERTFITKLGSLRPAHKGVSQTGGMPNPMVSALADRGILKSGQRYGSHWYELQHERLIDPIHQARRLHSAETASDTNGAEHYLRTAETSLANGELELAQTHAEEVLRRCGGHDFRTAAEAESLLGKIVSQAGRLTAAEGHFLRSAEYFETLQDSAAVGLVLAEVGRLLLALRSYADAVDMLQTAVNSHPDDLVVQAELARALWSAGDRQAAAAVYGGVLNIAPGSAEALAGRGQILVELHDDVSALEDLDHLFRLQPPDNSRWAEERAARALSLARLDRLDEAVCEAETAIEDAPHSGPVLLHAAGVNRVAGEPARATELLHRAREAQNPALFPRQREEVDRLLAEAA